VKGRNIEARSCLTLTRNKHQAVSLQPEAATGSRRPASVARVVNCVAKCVLDTIEGSRSSQKTWSSNYARRTRLRTVGGANEAFARVGLDPGDPELVFEAAIAIQNLLKLRMAAASLQGGK